VENGTQMEVFFPAFLLFSDEFSVLRENSPPMTENLVFCTQLKFEHFLKCNFVFGKTRHFQ